jgi:hypothetical protein
MSRWIRLSDSKGRHARVRMESREAAPSRQFQADDGRLVKAARIIKSPLPKTYSYLRSRCNDDRELARILMESDPDIDYEAAGRKTGPTDRVLLDSDDRVLYAASEIEIVIDSDGDEVERRQPVDTPANIDVERPLVWTGKTFKRLDAVRRFVFSRNYQVRHIDGLTFDFLFAMAQELERVDSLILIGAGTRGTEPIVPERNGLPYRGFLEGRIKGDTYLLMLHLTHLELLTSAEISP